MENKSESYSACTMEHYSNSYNVKFSKGHTGYNSGTVFKHSQTNIKYISTLGQEREVKSFSLVGENIVTV